MKIKYYKSSEPNVACIQDLDQSYQHVMNLDAIFGTRTSKEAHQQNSIELFEILKANGYITSFEIL